MPGRILEDRPKPNLLAQMGAFMAQLHYHTEQFALPDGITLPHTSWDKLRYWQDRQNDTSAILTTEQRNLCAVASQRLLAEIEQVGTDADYGLIHADLSMHNCLVHQGQLRVIDFADCRFGSHFYDISVPLTYLDEYQNYEASRAAFYEGYSSVRPLGEGYKAVVETFMVARSFDMIEWIHFDWPSLTHFWFGPELLSSAIRRIRHYMQ
jgi:Ser/Thr protein kinase RdoA (MazF antagonist)